MISPKYFDHTILKQDAERWEVEKVCKEALKYGFASVCVNSYYTEYVSKLLSGSDVKVCTVVGFPLGMCATKVKAFEAAEAVKSGADEIDMVMNVGALKENAQAEVLEDIYTVRKACDTAGEEAGKSKIILKVIIETCLLDDAEKALACQIAEQAGADFVKTSTGFSSGGANAEDVMLMKAMVGDRIKVKASGGIRDAKTAREMLDAGADRLGTSATVSIIGEAG